jgi:hypothetical protein
MLVYLVDSSSSESSLDSIRVQRFGRGILVEQVATMIA